MRVLTEADVTRAADIGMALASAERCAAAVAGGQVSASRAQVNGDGAWIRSLVAILPESDVMGYKVLLGGQRGGARFFCQLFRVSTGEPLALIDAATITRLRTSAHAAIAVAHAFPDEAITVGVVGSGHEAQQALRTMAHRSRVKAASVWSPRESSRIGFATSMSDELGIPIRPAESVRQCLRDVDVAYTATTSGGQVVVRQDDLTGVRMLSTIGSTTPRQREIEPAVFTGAGRIVVDTMDCLTDSGDLLACADEAPSSPIAVELLGHYLETEPLPSTGLLVYKSIGSAEQDILLALDVFTAASDRGIGATLPG
ncbi:hypothetical protein ACQP1V_29325 [Microtetraspora malaysiensis]|uniref:hypothetical protein n=1 Tax=Microtetraspora malaysiensis TaxID=161358 RepID=UPI003D94D8B2